mmetsp:Transcript_119326/g.234413  ORF Transcript_119326/g.234413 Transcript_119326/m.234413 type:complete len:172 (+) Transcript_119326:87-602(+)
MSGAWDQDDDWDDYDDSAPSKPTKAAFSPPARKQEPKAKSKPAPAAEVAKPKAAAVPEQKVVNKDSMQELEVTLQMHVHQLVKMVTPKIAEAKAKAAPHKFLSDILRGSQVKLTLQEAESLQKTCKELVAKRKKAEAEAKKKALEEEAERKKKEAEEKGMQADEDFFADYM